MDRDLSPPRGTSGFLQAVCMLKAVCVEAVPSSTSLPGPFPHCTHLASPFITPWRHLHGLHPSWFLSGSGCWLPCLSSLPGCDFPVWPCTPCCTLGFQGPQDGKGKASHRAGVSGDEHRIRRPGFAPCPCSWCVSLLTLLPVSDPRFSVGGMSRRLLGSNAGGKLGSMGEGFRDEPQTFCMKVKREYTPSSG